MTLTQTSPLRPSHPLRQPEPQHQQIGGESSAPVLIAEAPEGIPAVRLAYLKTQDLKTVMAVPIPGENREFAIATEVLEALGKRLDVTGLPRVAIRRAELVTIWLNAHRVQRLIVGPCQRANPKLLLGLVEMVKATPTQLVFVCDHGFADPLRSALRSANPEMMSWPDLPTESDAFTPARIDHSVESWATNSTALPAVEYWTFHATCSRLLPPEQFSGVDALYREVVARLTSWLATLGCEAENLTADLAFEALKTLIEEQTNLDEVTVAIRAAQAAFHRAGWFVGVDERELRNGLIRFPSSRTTPDTYDALRCYFEPIRAANVALYLAGATPASIGEVTLEDLSRWHRDPGCPLANVVPPTAAHPYLRAALLIAAFYGKSPDTPVLRGDDRRVLRDIRQAAKDLGINIGDANLEKNSAIGQRRIPKRILKLERIA